MSRFARHLLYAGLAVSVCAGSAGAQLLGGGVGLPPLGVPAPVANAPVAPSILQNLLGSPQLQKQVVQPTLDGVAGLPMTIAQSGSSTLAALRRMRLQTLIRENRDVLEADEHGLPVRRGILIVADPDPISLQSALRAGFPIASEEVEQSLGLRLVKLAVLNGLSTRDAMKRLRKAVPRLEVDYDHVFEPAGGSLVPLAASLASMAERGNGRVIGMIDGGVASHPSLAGSSIEQNGFAGAPKPTGHGTAVASLLVGSNGPFRGAANGAGSMSPMSTGAAMQRVPPRQSCRRSAGSPRMARRSSISALSARRTRSSAERSSRYNDAASALSLRLAMMALQRRRNIPPPTRECLR